MVAIASQLKMVAITSQVLDFSVFTDAPLPKDVIWDNVGLRHNEQLISYVLAQAAAVGLCLVWTFPVALFTSLSEAGSLTEVMPNRKVPLDRRFFGAFIPSPSRFSYCTTSCSYWHNL
mmetsp:Transcript_18503/g.28116  ORF Transcript_18503/g.28116 Transcript_18503/m.28116 type:complete len:118 (+) Transcript_18503:458-811(+)